MNDAADFADTAIISIGRSSMEGIDRAAKEGIYLLSQDERNLIQSVKAAGFTNVVAVLNTGSIIDTKWIQEYGIDAVLLAWMGGMEGGNAMADILCGDVNPSGKLMSTFAKNYSDYPTSKTFNESSAYVNYEEDIFVGYRYFETFDPDYEKVAYEFGYGLSYTFDITNVDVSVSDDTVTVNATVKNTGDVAGREVVQVYYSAPQGVLGNPAKELGAFAKTDLLSKGEEEILTMTYKVRDMASYDDLGKIAKSAYILEEGKYNIYVGNSIRNAGENGIRYTIYAG